MYSNCSLKNLYGHSNREWSKFPNRPLLLESGRYRPICTSGSSVQTEKVKLQGKKEVGASNQIGL